MKHPLWQGTVVGDAINMVSQKGFDFHIYGFQHTVLRSLFLLKSGMEDGPPHPRKTVVVLSVGQMPSLGPRPRTYLSNPYDFPDGHSGLCGS